MNKDKLINIDSTATAQETYKLIDQLQSLPAEMQLAVTAILFKVAAGVWKAEPQDVFTVVGNIMSDPIHGEKEHFRALRLYAQHELKAGG